MSQGILDGLTEASKIERESRLNTSVSATEKVEGEVTEGKE